MREFIKNVLIKIFFTPQFSSFSQSGEDRIIHLIAKIIGLKDIYYLDIGASHPINLSNTYYFYLMGNTGVCIEANSERVRMLKRVRPKDTCLHFGVCGKLETPNTKNTFFVMPSAALSSFSKKHVEATHQPPLREEEVDMIGINDLIATHCERTPNLVSLDVEGLDLEILRAWDFTSYQPDIFCLETLSYSDKNSAKLYEIIEYMTASNYTVVADTYVNTILVRTEAWNKTRSQKYSTIYPAQP